jgi:hypothetical protein
LDLCDAPQCVGARVTREDLEGVHEPSHRFVKVRTTLFLRNLGRAYAAALDAFKRVEETCRRISESTLHPDKETRPDEKKASSFGSSSTEIPAKSDKLDDVLSPPGSSKGGVELERAAERDAKEDQVQDQCLPVCCKCNDQLSFPFWYCVICEG